MSNCIYTFQGKEYTLEQLEDLVKSNPQAFLDFENTGKVTQTYIKTPSEGVNKMFELNPMLSKVGSPMEYQQYIESLHPNSKIWDILYLNPETNKIYRTYQDGFKPVKVDVDSYEYITNQDLIEDELQIGQPNNMENVSLVENELEDYSSVLTPLGNTVVLELGSPSDIVSFIEFKESLANKPTLSTNTNINQVRIDDFAPNKC